MTEHILSLDESSSMFKILRVEFLLLGMILTRFVVPGPNHFSWYMVGIPRASVVPSGTAILFANGRGSRTILFLILGRSFPLLSAQI